VTRRKLPLDASAILRTLEAFEVAYVLIGGLAVQTHGHPRTTQELDLVPEPSEENRERLRSALLSLGARRAGATAPEPIEIPQDGVLELDTDAGGVDIHLDPPGAAPYAELRARALEVELDTVVPVVGLDDLISMKRVRGREIDRLDIVALTEPTG
jgi:hypothetical protein